MASSYTSQSSVMMEKIIASSDGGSERELQGVPKGHLQIIVEDSGVGIAMNDQGNLFKPFE